MQNEWPAAFTKRGQRLSSCVLWLLLPPRYWCQIALPFSHRWDLTSGRECVIKNACLETHVHWISWMPQMPTYCEAPGRVACTTEMLLKWLWVSWAIAALPYLQEGTVLSPPKNNLLSLQKNNVNSFLLCHRHEKLPIFSLQWPFTHLRAPTSHPLFFRPLPFCHLPLRRLFSGSGWDGTSFLALVEILFCLLS